MFSGFRDFRGVQQPGQPGNLNELLDQNVSLVPYTGEPMLPSTYPVSYTGALLGPFTGQMAPSSLAWQEQLRTSHPLTSSYGTNHSNNFQMDHNPILPYGTSVPLLQDLSMQYRIPLSMEGSHSVPSFTPSFNTYADNRELSRQHEDSIPVSQSENDNSVFEDRYSSTQGWSSADILDDYIRTNEEYSINNRGHYNYISPEISNPDPVRKEGFFGVQNWSHSDVGEDKNYNMDERDYSFSPRHTDRSSSEVSPCRKRHSRSPLRRSRTLDSNAGHRSSTSKKRYHSPSREMYHSPSRVTCRYYSPSRERLYSPSRDRTRKRHPRSPLRRSRTPDSNAGHRSSTSKKRYHSPSRERYRSPSRVTCRYYSPSRERYHSPSRDRTKDRKETSFSPHRSDSSRSNYKSLSGTKRHNSPDKDGNSSYSDKKRHESDKRISRNRPTESSTVRESSVDVNKKSHTSHQSPRPQDNNKVASRALRCYCLPEPNIQRTITHQKSDKYYAPPNASSVKSTCVATQAVLKLHKEFEEKLAQTSSQIPLESSNPDDVPDNMDDDRQYVSKLLEKTDETDSDISDVESDIDLDGFVTVDESDSDSSDNDRPSWPNRSFRVKEHPKRLNPELWFNIKGELNQGCECLCNAKDKQKWIVHSIYANEKMPDPCEQLGNNGLKLYHYWVTVSPHTNFMTENPTTIESHGKTYTFEGFSLLTHSPLDAIPQCSLTRFNIKYEIFFIQEPIPDNFCIRDVDLFSDYLFHDILEMYDWDISNGGNGEHCNLFHFLPRFTRKIGTSADGSDKYELLSMRKVFEHLINSRKPLVQDIHSNGKRTWQEVADSCVNSLVTKPGWRPSSFRVDKIERPRQDGKGDPVIVHHGIRPVQLSFSGDAKCRRLLKSYLKLRNSIMNRPDSSQKERLKLIRMKLALDNMKMKDCLRRDCCVRVNAGGVIKTGLNSDVTQHALLLPVLVHHVRYHLSLQTFDQKLGYQFKDRELLQLALTHPSYVMNYGTNPDHARNTLSNCGVKQPRYGDRRNRYKHLKKKGIVHLIEIMAKLEDLEGSQSFIHHNERLEFLGDAILEFICTTHLFFLFPEMNEGDLVTHRSSLVRNSHLAIIAKKLDLDTFMQFSHGPDLCHDDDMNHAMANCFEALLGAIYLDSDANTVRRVFCKQAFEEPELRELWSNLKPHPLQTQQPDGDRHFIPSSDVLKKLVKLEVSIGVQFDHIRLLARAFTHPQVGFNNLTLGNNQRMEFLGDSVVQWVVTDYLYRHFPEHHEGHLTLLRSSLVNRNIQAQIAGEIGLNEYVNFGVGQVTPKLRQKHMSDLFEAFLAALFVDKGLELIRVFCKVCLFPRLKDVIINQEWLDAKSQLQSCCLTQARNLDNLPVYKILKDVGSTNMKLYTVGVYHNGRRLGTGEGDNVREAEMRAAHDALTSNYFPEYARQKRVLNQKHKKLKNPT